MASSWSVVCASDMQRSLVRVVGHAVCYFDNTFIVPSVAEWIKALESDASAGGESPVRAPVRAATLCPYA